MKKTIVFVVALIVSVTSFAQNATVRAKQFNLEKGLAIQGYDPVAYFSQKQAVKGNKSFSASSQGTVYYFSNEANKESFLKMPAAYEPQYGGWCAFAMGSKGEKIDVNPETFKIINNKLYLFYNAFFNNTLKSWNKDETGLKTKADANWLKTIQ